MPRHSAVERYRITSSIKIYLETAPVEAENSAISWGGAKAGGPARPYVSWDRGTKRHGLYMSHFKASQASADTPAWGLGCLPSPQTAAATAEDANGCVTHTRMYVCMQV